MFDDFVRNPDSPDTFYDCYFQWYDAWQTEALGESGITPNRYQADAQQDFEDLVATIDSFDVVEYYENNYPCQGICTEQAIFYLASPPEYGRPENRCNYQVKDDLKFDWESI